MLQGLVQHRPGAAASRAAGGSSRLPCPQVQQSVSLASASQRRRGAVLGRAAAQQQQQQQQQEQQRVPPLPSPPEQQQQQQQRVQPAREQPFLVRVAGRTSSVTGAAGAVAKRLRTDDAVRVAAIDANSIFKALIVLTAANNMVAANGGSMLVFQPREVTAESAEPPRLPEGSLVMTTSQVVQGEVLASNTMVVRGSTNTRKLGDAIVFRMRAEGHTVLECFGPVAATVALLAAAAARKKLLRKNQDLAIVITSQPMAPQQPQQADGAGGSGSAGGNRPPLRHRLVLLECKPYRPRALLVRASIGVTDRVPRGPPPAAPAAVPPPPAPAPAS